MTHTFEREPLEQYRLLQSDDVDFSRKIVTELYCPHTLLPLEGDRVNARLNAVEGKNFNFGFLTYGVNTKIDLPPLPDCYHVNLTLSGKSQIIKKGDTVLTEGLKGGAILLPEHTYNVLWNKNTKQFAFRFRKQQLESHLASLIRQPVKNTIEFETLFSLNNNLGKSLLSACHLLQKEWEINETIHLSPIAKKSLESYVMTSFLTATLHPFSEHLYYNYETKDVNEQLVDKVVEYIEDYIYNLPTLEDLTNYANVSARTLQLAFKRYKNMTPMNYVQLTKLKKAHEDLRRAKETNEKIIDIAIKWGFYNPGRFSAIYKKEFGQLPSETIKESK